MASLSEPVIVDAAIDLVEREGEGALTMRRLGATLEVEAMSLYHHISGRKALVHAMAGRLMEPLGVVSLEGGWREACAAFARTLREVAVSRPVVFRLVASDPFDAHSALLGVERLLQVLVRHGHAPNRSLAIYRAVAAYTRGYALAEATGFTVDAQTLEGRRRLAALPADGFPVLTGPGLERLDRDGGFQLGLVALVAGLPEPGA